MWQVKCNMRLMIVSETDQVLYDLWLIQESEFISANRLFTIDAGVPAEIIIIAKARFIQYLIHHPAARTAKVLSMGVNTICPTFFATMKTLEGIFDPLYCHNSYF